MRRYLSVCLLAVAALLPLDVVAAPKAVPLKVEGDVITVVKSLPVKVIASPGATLYDWTFPDTVKGTAEDHVLTITAAPKGTFKVRCRSLTIDFDKKTVTKELSEVEVNVGEVTPPTPPVPPTPGPKPPDPLPDPKSFNILILFEEQRVKELSAEQRSMIYGKAFHDTLNANTPMGEKGTHEWRIYDQDVDLSGVPTRWEAARKRAKSNKDFKTPWLILFDGETDIYSGPLDKTRDETIALINKYAPKKRSKK